MENLVCYKTLPVWQKTTIPMAFTDRHNTAEGTWAQLTVLAGEMDFVVFGENGEETRYHFDTAHQPPRLDPQVWHKIESVSDDISCQLAFWCQPEDEFYKIHGLTRPHSEVRELVTMTKPGKTLDLGSGRGRNSFFLAQLGYDVTAMDINPQHIQAIEDVKATTGISNIRTQVYDINQHALQDDYDIIISTVVLMFLKRENIAAIIADMQAHTRPDGYNLIVCPVETESMPYDELPFDCFLKPGELSGYYADWEILKYNENPGHLHRTDAAGNRIRLNFATLIARKKD